MTTTFGVGEYARSLETGWLGKIVEITDEVTHIDENRSYTWKQAKMIGVDIMANLVLGMSAEESLSHDDVQWFALDDLIPA